MIYLVKSRVFAAIRLKGFFIINSLPVNLMRDLIRKESGQDVPGHPLHILASDGGQRRNLKGKDIFYVFGPVERIQKCKKT